MEDGDKLMTGTVRRWDDAKGYGFIRVFGITEDIFVHQTEIKMEGFRELVVGETVQFRIARHSKGWKAKDVVKVDSSEQPSSQPDPAKS